MFLLHSCFLKHSRLGQKSDVNEVLDPLCVFAFCSSRSLHFHLVRELTGEFDRLHSGMVLLLHVETF